MNKPGTRNQKVQPSSTKINQVTPAIRSVALAKHRGTQTCEADTSTSICKSTTIKNLFYQKNKKNTSSLDNKAPATGRLMQTLFVKPRYESTPLKFSEDHQHSDSDCEMLVENVTPIRMRSKSLLILNNSPKEHTNRMCKSDNVSDKLCRNLTANEMLSLDETCLKGLDLDVVEHLPNRSKTSSQVNFGDSSETAAHLSLDPSTEGSEVNGIVNDVSVVENIIPDRATLEMPPPVSVPKCTRRTSSFCQVSRNQITVVADVHWDELKSIDVDNWVDDSFMESVLIKSTSNHPAEIANASKKTCAVTKRQLQDYRQSNLNKKQKKSNNSTPESNMSCQKTTENQWTLPYTDSNSSILPIGKEACITSATKAQERVGRRCEFSVIPSAVVSRIKPFFGLPIEVQTLFEKYKGIRKLYDWQEECLSLRAVEEKTNLVFALPTSGGKTLVAEILLLRELLCDKKNVLFVLPFVSIVQEKVHSLSQFAIDLGFLVEEYAAGKGQYPPKKRRHKQTIYVATIEKAHSLINSMMDSNRLTEIGLTIVDELHLLGEGDRGATLECLLTKLLFCCEKMHIVGMSATIGNLEEVATFLRAEIYVNNFRPVELQEYVKCEDWLWKVENEGEFLKKVRKIDPPYTDLMNKMDPDKVCSLVLEVIPENSCLVFCPTKRNCENLASLFTKLMPRELLDVRLEERCALSRALVNEGRGSVCPVLERCVPFGVAYHHSGLTMNERRLLEEAYRTGTLSCICCTSTLAAGVNLPAKRVILRAPFIGNSFLNLSQYKQMVGRAGRAGLDVKGESILVCRPCDMERVGSLLTSGMNSVASQLHTSSSRGLHSLVLSAIGLGIAKCRKDLNKMVSHTLLHVQSENLNVKSTDLVDKSIASLFSLRALLVDTAASSSNASKEVNSSCASQKANLSLNISPLPERKLPDHVRETEGQPAKKRFDIGRKTCLKISRLGRAAIKGPIDLGRSHELYGDLVKAQTSLVLLSHLHLLFLVTPYDMMDQIKPDPDIYYYSFNCLNKKDQQTAAVLGISFGCVIKFKQGVKSFQTVEERVFHRFYITLILNDLWNHGDVWQVAKKYSIPRGTVQVLMTSAATFASSVMHFCAELKEFWSFEELLKKFAQRLQHCCSADLLPLMDLPAVKTGRARQLFNAGYTTLLLIANASPSELVSSVDHLPRKTADQIIAAAKMLLLSTVENLREQAEDIENGMIRK